MSDEVEQNSKVSFKGYLLKAKGKDKDVKQGKLPFKWKQSFFVFENGVVSFYADSSMSSMGKVFTNLAYCNSITTIERDDDTPVIALSVSKHHVLFVTTGSQTPEDMTVSKLVELINKEKAGANTNQQLNRNSWFLRAKKNVASKTAVTKLGESLILQALGQNGVVLLHDILEFTTRDSDAAQADRHKKFLLKLVAKIAIMENDSAIFTEVQYNTLATAANTFENRFVEITNPEPHQLAQQCTIIKDTCYEALKSRMTEKNLQTFIEICEYYGSVNNLQKLTTTSTYADLYKSMVASIQAINAHQQQQQQ